MVDRCLRCTQVVEGSDEVLCLECFAICGPPPSDHHNICDYCGDHWIESMLVMCDECLKASEVGPYMN